MLSLLMFGEQLGVAATSRCEQREVQHLQEDAKKGTSSTFFLHLRFIYILVWVYVYETFALPTFKVH
jgi:hypothetical protein